jgi:hypothetical protein
LFAPVLARRAGRVENSRPEGGHVLRLLSAVVKIAVVSLITGTALSALDITAADVLSELGLTPENVLALLERGVSWAIPNIVLGSMVIVPIWLVIYLLRPPRG